MLTKIKNALKRFGGNIKNFFCSSGRKIKNWFCCAGRNIKKFFCFLGRNIKKFFLTSVEFNKNLFSKTINYIKSLNKKAVIIIAVILITVIAVIVALMINNSKTVTTMKHEDAIKFSTNYDGNLINIFSDEIVLTPYGNMAYSNDGANKKSLELKDGYLEMSKAFGFDKEFSYQSWVKIKDTSTVNPVLFGKASSTGDMQNGPITIKFYNEYKTILCDMTFIDANDQYVSHSFSTDNFLNPESLINIWHHVAVTFDENGYTLYFDGNVINNIPKPADLEGFKKIADNQNPFFIGVGEGEVNMKAKIDETLIYSYTLSAEEIKAEYERSHPAKTHRIVMKVDNNIADVDGEAKELEGKVLKDIKTETYLVPLKSVTEFIGGTFIKDEAEADKFDISYKNKNVSLWLMDTNALTNGIHTKLDSYPQEFDGLVYVPVDMFADLFNLEISASDESIIINY